MQIADQVLAHPQYQAAAAALEAGFEDFVAGLLALVQIPAPPFDEARRASAFLERLSGLGLEGAGLDGIGNVTALRPGAAPGQDGVVVISAHLDTVFPAGTDLTPRREGHRWFAPGIGDDTRGLATILALLRAMQAAGLRTQRDLLICADVGEEGAGDLRGTRYLFEQGPWAGRIGAYFSLDGAQMERLVTGAVGSRRYRICFNGPGGHSLNDFGIVNPAYALGDFLSGMAALSVPQDPKTSYAATMFGGGTSINAIPQQVWTEVDLRSVSAPELERLDQQMRALVEQAVAAENARNDTRKGPVCAGLRPIGNRPAAAPRASGPVVDECFAVLTAMGYPVVLESASTDANIPLSLGIPAVTIGNGAASGLAHTTGEWTDLEPQESLRAMRALLASILAVAGIA